jgi:hypothetical protein
LNTVRRIAKNILVLFIAQMITMGLGSLCAGGGKIYPSKDIRLTKAAISALDLDNTK